MERSYTKEEVRAATLEYFKGNELQTDVFIKKYALRDKQDNFYELTPADMHHRLAREFARIEQKYPNPLTEDQIFQYLERFQFIVPAGSVMYGAGNQFQVTSLSNCSIISPPADNMSGIFNTARDMANLYKRRMGVGVDISTLRPDGSPVSNAAGTSTGAWSFADFYSYVTRMVGQKNRRGALMLTMDCRHPDIERFITMKTDLMKVTGANVSVRISDAFMEAVEKDEDWQLAWPCDWEEQGLEAPVVSRVIHAKDLFQLIAKTAWQSGEPGVLFWDTVRKNMPLEKYPGFNTVGTNPCLLGSTRMLTREYGLATIEELAGKEADFWTSSGWARGTAWRTGHKEVVKVRLSDGQEITTTYNHRILFGGEWIEAQHSNGKTPTHLPGIGYWQGTLDHDRERIVHDGLGHSPENALPSTVWAMSSAQAAAFLRGMFSANGSVLKPGRITYKTTNPVLVQELITLLSAFGFRPYKTTAGNTYSVNIPTSGSQAKLFESVIGFVQEEKRSRLQELTGKPQRHLPRVVAVEPAGTADVYDFSVPGVNSGWANGFCVHNCGEIPAASEDLCRLVSITLVMITNVSFKKGANFDYTRLRDVATVAMRLADDLVDLELEKLQAIWERADTQDEKDLIAKFIQKARDGRRTGIGTHGLADALAALMLRYDSDEAVAEIDKIYRELKLATYRASIELAKERGPFPIWDWEYEKDCEFFKDFPEDLLADMRKYGRRNGAILTNAPTGTVSIMSNNCSSGIEPVFQLDYTRKRKLHSGETPDLVDPSGDGWKEYHVSHSNVQRYYDMTGAKPGDPLPDYFVTSDKIDWLKRAEIQGVITRHIDHSVSNTVNLPTEAPVDVVEQLYMAAWKKGCKGMTVYRAGSRPAEVLSAGKPAKPRVHRPRVTNGGMTKAAFTNSVGHTRKVYCFVGKNDDGKVVETFLIDEFGGPEVHSYSAAVGRLTSLLLKANVPVSKIASRLVGLRGDSQSFSGGMYSSVPDFLGKLLLQETQQSVQAPAAADSCPSCRQPLAHSEGCVKCPSCGWTKC